MTTLSEALEIVQQCYQSGNLADAEQICLQIIKQNPDIPEVYHQLATLYYQQKKFSEAIAACHQALKYNPDFAVVYDTLSQILEYQEKPEAALRAYTKACELQPDLARGKTYNNLGYLLAERGNLDLSITCFQQAIQLSPNFYFAHFNLGMAYKVSGKFHEAIPYFQRAITLKPHETDTYFRLGQTLKAQSRHGEAIAVFKQALEIEPNRLDILIELANFLARRGLLQESIDYYQKILEIEPKFAEPYFQQRGFLKNADAWITLPTHPPKRVCSFSHHLSGSSILDYIPIYPQTSATGKPPKTLDPEIHPNLRGDVGDYAEAFVAAIPNGRAWGDYYASLVITPAQQLLADVATGDGNVALIFALNQLPPLHQLEGTVAFLSVSGGVDYYHWMLDLLPRFDLLRRSGYLDQINTFVINDLQHSFQKQTLNHLNIPMEKIITSNQYPYIQADQLITTSIPATRPKWLSPLIEGAPKWACEFLRHEFLPAIPPKHSNLPKRIYISRKAAKYRQILNEDDVIHRISQYGFQPIVLESFSVLEQIALLANAEAVIAPHGAGLTHLVFCNPHTKVIEIFSPTYVRSCYWIMSNVLNLDYYYLLGEVLDYAILLKNRQHPEKTLYDSRADGILVNLDSLLQLMKLSNLVD